MQSHFIMADIVFPVGGALKDDLRKMHDMEHVENKYSMIQYTFLENTPFTIPIRVYCIMLYLLSCIFSTRM